MYFNLLPDSVKSAETIILIDGGYFVFRMTKHWSKKGKMYKAHRDFKAKKINYFQRQALFKKAIEADIAYIGFRLGKLKKNPKYESKCKIIVCWDGIKGRRKRGLIHPLYKANRYGAEEDYNASEHTGVDIREKITKMGLEPNNLEKGWYGLYEESLEGDDLIAELTVEAVERNKDVIVLSSDSDMIQLLEYPITLHDFTNVVTKESIIDKYGVFPSQYADWKTLVGDVSDNISGMMFVGKKKATELIQNYGDLDSIPNEVFITYKPKYDITNRMKEIRRELGYSLLHAKQKIGSSWETWEKGNLKECAYASVQKIIETVGESHFDRKDYRTQLQDMKKIVKIPFK